MEVLKIYVQPFMSSYFYAYPFITLIPHSSCHLTSSK